MIVRHMLAMDQEHEYYLLYNDEAHLNTYQSYPNVKAIAIQSRSKFFWDQVIVPWLAWKHKLDVIFNPKLTVPLLTGCLTVFCQHGADWFVMPEQYEVFDRLYFTLFARLYWWKANRIISISKDTEQRLARIMNKKTAAKLCTIYHGVDKQFALVQDPAAVKALRDKYGLHFPFALYLGQIYKMKNVGNLIRAFAKLRGRILHRLVLVGQPGAKSEADLTLIDELGVSDIVVQIGWVPDDDVPLFYQAADLFTFPSLYEGFGIPIIEAMASGCPVLTSTGGACPEVAGDAALLVDPHEVDEISEGIFRGLTDTKLREELRQRGSLRAREFTWERSAAQTIELLESMVSHRRGSRAYGT
jgi:glycosyltransferase involved in cell wall biosynthesis